MPEISLYYGIRVAKYCDGHNPPHFQAEYNGNKAIISLKLSTQNEEIRTLKAGLSGIVKQHGFATVQDFYTAFYNAQRATDAYQKECARWMKPTVRKFFQKPKPYTKRYDDIKIKLIGRMPETLPKQK